MGWWRRSQLTAFSNSHFSDRQYGRRLSAGTLQRLAAICIYSLAEHICTLGELRCWDTGIPYIFQVSTLVTGWVTHCLFPPCPFNCTPSSFKEVSRRESFYPWKCVCNFFRPAAFLGQAVPLKDQVTPIPTDQRHTFLGQPYDTAVVEVVVNVLP